MTIKDKLNKVRQMKKIQKQMEIKDLTQNKTKTQLKIIKRLEQNQTNQEIIITYEDEIIRETHKQGLKNKTHT